MGKIPLARDHLRILIAALLAFWGLVWLAEPGQAGVIDGVDDTGNELQVTLTDSEQQAAQVGQAVQLRFRRNAPLLPGTLDKRDGAKATITLQRSQPNLKAGMGFRLYDSAGAPLDGVGGNQQSMSTAQFDGPVNANVLRVLKEKKKAVIKIKPSEMSYFASFQPGTQLQANTADSGVEVTFTLFLKRKDRIIVDLDDANLGKLKPKQKLVFAKKTTAVDLSTAVIASEYLVIDGPLHLVWRPYSYTGLRAERKDTWSQSETEASKSASTQTQQQALWQGVYGLEDGSGMIGAAYSHGLVGFDGFSFPIDQFAFEYAGVFGGFVLGLELNYFDAHIGVFGSSQDITAFYGQLQFGYQMGGSLMYLGVRPAASVTTENKDTDGEDSSSEKTTSKDIATLINLGFQSPARGESIGYLIQLDWYLDDDDSEEIELTAMEQLGFKAAVHYQLGENMLLSGGLIRNTSTTGIVSEQIGDPNAPRTGIAAELVWQTEGGRFGFGLEYSSGGVKREIDVEGASEKVETTETATHGGYGLSYGLIF